MSIPIFFLDDYERGCLETAIDAEGRISILRHVRKNGSIGHAIKVDVSNNSFDFVKKFQDICGGEIEGGSINTEDHKGRLFYRFDMNVRCMRRILPQLSFIIKDEQRKLALELLESTEFYSKLNYGKPVPRHAIEYRECLYEACIELNKKGGRG